MEAASPPAGQSPAPDLTEGLCCRCAPQEPIQPGPYQPPALSVLPCPIFPRTKASSSNSTYPPPKVGLGGAGMWQKKAELGPDPPAPPPTVAGSTKPMGPSLGHLASWEEGALWRPSQGHWRTRPGHSSRQRPAGTHRRTGVVSRAKVKAALLVH